MKRSFLARLQRAALFSLIGALMLLLVVPTLQLLVLGPQGYGTALTSPQASLLWIQEHTLLFLLYRLALMVGFALLLGVPFALFRIIVAQEIIGREEIEREEKEEKAASEENSLPPFAWRGKGFAVIAAWLGLPGLLLAAGGTLASTIYLWSSASIVTAQTPLPDNFASVTGIFSVLTYTIGGGFVALSCIFFGFVIARSGRKLWPDSWVAFGYAGLAVGAVASGSAVQVALTPLGSQTAITTFAVLFIAAWLFWFSLMVIRLKAEQG